ncbi:hypothetical protein [Helicobacter turcicus]|uniref:Uncharacterized protein n=1 Tax=Helicobacter turcicus TaxID=2867412 RepID=A0ABS7JMQ1_9HELI|nr:hypothetical protein [Helicobacter turcicus]MBX7490662.1 hypothetical protein [Helicobacter turcicus]MBX7545430.1 hypothetical protein [Helicobacter turcicus]
MKPICLLLFLFFGIFAFADNVESAIKQSGAVNTSISPDFTTNKTTPKDALILPPLHDSNAESQNLFPFETGRSPLEGISGFQYFGVILILLGLLAFLWYVKNRLNVPKLKVRTGSFRFFNKDANESEGQIDVQSVTALSVQSKLVVFEAYNKRYLVILNPNDTTLIDSYEIKSTFKDMLDQDNQNNAK